MISHPGNKHRGLKFLVLDEKSERLSWADKNEKNCLQYLILMISKCFMCDLFFIKKKIYFYYNQLKFQNKVTLNKKLKQVVSVAIFFPTEEIHQTDSLSVKHFNWDESAFFKP